MPNYRIDILNKRIVALSIQMHYESDEDALADAAEMVSAEYGVEVWCHNRLVERLAPRKRSDQG